MLIDSKIKNPFLQSLGWFDFRLNLIKVLLEQLLCGFVFNVKLNSAAAYGRKKP
jgi:hypothetical protein